MKDMVRELLEKARDGDEEAFTQIFTLYQNSVFVKARKIMQNDANAQDVVQETFLIVHKNLQQLRDLDLFYSWLMRITISRCHMHFRKEKHYAKESYEESIVNQKEERTYLDPEQSMHEKNTREILLTLIDSLSPKKAMVVKMAYLDEMRMDEIADVLGINVNTVKTRAKRGKAELQKKIKEYEKREKISLRIHADVILPTTFFVTALQPNILHIIQQKCMKSIQYVKQHVVMSSCCASLSVLAVSGSVFLYQDIQEQLNMKSVPQVQEPSINKAENEDIKEPNSPIIMKANTISFAPVIYHDDTVKTPRDAYYICLVFAENKDDFLQKSKEELSLFHAVYNALKESGSPYYTQLKDMGWAIMYEEFLSK